MKIKIKEINELKVPQASKTCGTYLKSDPSQAQDDRGASLKTLLLPHP